MVYRNFGKFLVSGRFCLPIFGINYSAQRQKPKFFLRVLYRPHAGFFDKKSLTEAVISVSEKLSKKV